MAKFEKAIINVRKNEGYFNQKLKDGQGLTYAGITEKSDPDWKGWSIIHAMPKVNGLYPFREEQIIPSVELLVNEYYKAKYWNLIKGDLIENQDLANLIFSFSVASGQWCKQTQLAINKAYKSTVLSVDGKFGNQTLSYLNKDAALVYPFIYQQRIEYMKGLPTWYKYAPSWMRMMGMFPTVIKNTASKNPILTIILLIGLSFLTVRLIK